MKYILGFFQELYPQRKLGPRIYKVGPQLALGIQLFLVVLVISGAAGATSGQPVMRSLSTSAPALASTPISEVQANNFYNDCATRPGALGTFTPLQRDFFCSCTATRMKTYLFVEDIRAMNDRASAMGRAALAKMLENVHFPCALKPIEDSVHQECLTRAAANPKFASAGQQHCGCLAKKMIDYVRTVGITDAINRLTTSGELVEPMDALRTSSGYSNEMIRNYYSCFNGVLP